MSTLSSSSVQTCIKNIVNTRPIFFTLFPFPYSTLTLLLSFNNVFCSCPSPLYSCFFFYRLLSLLLFLYSFSSFLLQGLYVLIDTVFIFSLFLHFLLLPLFNTDFS